MAEIKYKAKIIFSEIINSSKPSFNENWKFSINGYNFRFLNEDELEVNFITEGNLLEKETGAIEIPSEYTDEIQIPEEKLEKILDLISIQIGHGLLIKPGSIECEGLGGASISIENRKIVELKEVEKISERLKYIENLTNNKELINALRFYRLGLCDENINGKAVKFWCAIEKMYAKSTDTVGQLLDSNEKKKLKAVLGVIKLSEAQKNRIWSRICETQQIPITKQISASIKLFLGKREMSEEEKNGLFQKFHSFRSTPGHGELLIKRTEENLTKVEEIENLLQELLSNEIFPSLNYYFFSLPGALPKKIWNGFKSSIIKVNTGLWLIPFKIWDERYFMNILRSSVIGKAFIGKPSGIFLITKDNDIPFKAEDLRLSELKTWEKIKKQYQLPNQSI